MNLTTFINVFESVIYDVLFCNAISYLFININCNCIMHLFWKLAHISYVLPLHVAIFAKMSRPFWSQIIFCDHHARSTLRPHDCQFANLLAKMNSQSKIRISNKLPLKNMTRPSGTHEKCKFLYTWKWAFKDFCVCLLYAVQCLYYKPQCVIFLTKWQFGKRRPVNRLSTVSNPLSASVI